MWKDIKVVINGFNIVTNEKLCIVKKGDFIANGDDFLTALQLGWLDKHNEFAPEFEILVFKQKRNTPNVFAAVVQQMNDNGKDVVATFNLDVTFKQPVEQHTTDQLLTAELAVIRTTINNSTAKDDLVDLGITEFGMSKSAAERLSINKLKLHLLNLLESQETLDIVSKMASAAAQERKN